MIYIFRNQEDTSLFQHDHRESMMTEDLDEYVAKSFQNLIL